jgi:G:T/U-mismatch repair DNA glycosylase
MIEEHPYSEIGGVCTQLLLTPETITIRGFKRGGIWFADTSTIICGTFPPRREYWNRVGYVHYSSPRNQFWKHIDAIYNTNLFAPNSVTEESGQRVRNSLQKVDFAIEKRLGFVDVFSKVSRKNIISADDDDLESIETIFDNGVFEEMLESGIRRFVFVYSLSRDTFIRELQAHYDVQIKELISYSTNNLPLQLMLSSIGTEDLFLYYCPIHGRILWSQKQKALKQIIDNEIPEMELISKGQVII